METGSRLIRPWEAKYDIRNTTVLAEVPELRVLDMTLNPNEFVPWHRHPSNADLFVGLQGEFQIHFADDKMVTVRNGERHEIAVDVPHTVVNVSAQPCRFLLLQGVGLYHYIPVDREVPGVQKALS